MMTRVSKTDIAEGYSIVLPADSKDLLFLDANKVIIRDAAASSYAHLFASFPGADIVDSGAVDAPPDQGTTDTTTAVAQDIVDLTAIDTITFTKYFDPVTKEELVKATLRIKNTSKFAANVQGVDARIYNPSA